MGKCCKCGKETKNEVPCYAKGSADSEWRECSAHYCAKCGILEG